MENIDLSNFPSDPSDYDFSSHFQNDVIQDEERHLTWKKAFGTIRHGKISEASGNADIEWVRDYHGVKCYLLCGHNSKKDVPVVITGWPGVHDPRQAIESGKWTEQELRDINDFNNGDGLEADFDFP